MVNIIWTLITILVALWIIGLVVHIGGGLIHLLLVVALVLLVINLMTGRRVA